MRGAFALHMPTTTSTKRSTDKTLNSRGVRANQMQAKIREAIISQPKTDLFHTLCHVHQAHLDGKSDLDHIPTLNRIHETICKKFSVGLTEKSLVKAARQAHDEMTRLASVEIKAKIIDVVDMWSIRAWRERIRAIDEGDRDETFTALREGYEGEAGVRLLSDDQFMAALKQAAGMRRRRGESNDGNGESNGSNTSDTGNASNRTDGVASSKGSGVKLPNNRDASSDVPAEERNYQTA